MQKRDSLIAGVSCLVPDNLFSENCVNENMNIEASFQPGLPQGLACTDFHNILYFTINVCKATNNRVGWNIFYNIHEATNRYALVYKG